MCAHQRHAHADVTQM